MKKSIFILFALSMFLLQSCVYKKVEDVKTLDLTEGNYLLTIKRGLKSAVAAPKNIEVNYDDDVLKISGGTSESALTLTLSETTLANITTINIGDGVTVLADSTLFTNDNLVINLEGNATFGGAFYSNNAKINMTNNSEFLIIKGQGQNLTLNMSNSTKYAAPALEWQNATVTLTDTAKCTIKVLGKLTVNASDESNLGYYGVTDSSFTTTGNATITRLPEKK